MRDQNQTDVSLEKRDLLVPNQATEGAWNEPSNILFGNRRNHIVSMLHLLKALAPTLPAKHFCFKKRFFKPSHIDKTSDY